MTLDHDPHPPFIRITDWHRDDHSQWMSAKSYCSICRKPVTLVFEDPDAETNEWEHVNTHWEHAGECRGGGEP
jgi:hypothetical protein